jgi:hypothetical protein
LLAHFCVLAQIGIFDLLPANCLTNTADFLSWYLEFGGMPAQLQDRETVSAMTGEFAKGDIRRNSNRFCVSRWISRPADPAK